MDIRFSVFSGYDDLWAFVKALIFVRVFLHYLTVIAELRVKCSYEHWYWPHDVLNSNRQSKTNCVCISSGPEPEPRLYTRTTRSPGTQNPNRNISPNPVNTSSSPGNVSIEEKEPTRLLVWHDISTVLLRDVSDTRSLLFIWFEVASPVNWQALGSGVFKTALTKSQIFWVFRGVAERAVSKTRGWHLGLFF